MERTGRAAPRFLKLHGQVPENAAVDAADLRDEAQRASKASALDLNTRARYAVDLDSYTQAPRTSVAPDGSSPPRALRLRFHLALARQLRLAQLLLRALGRIREIGESTRDLRHSVTRTAVTTPTVTEVPVAVT